MFTHLHVHSDGSELDGMSTPRELATRAHQLGMTAIALTDHGSLASVITFDRECHGAGVKPIIGEEFYLALGSRFDHTSITVVEGDPTSGDGEKTKRYEHITLIAMNQVGWANLVHLHNESHQSVWYKPRIDYDLMAQFSDGIICLTGCIGGPILGPISRYVAAKNARDDLTHRVSVLAHKLAAKGIDGQTLITQADTDHDFPAEDTDVHEFIRLYRASTTPINGSDGWDEAYRNLTQLVSIYGHDRVFVELMEHGLPQESAALPYAVDLATQVGVKCVATNDSHYTHANDQPSHDGWLALRTATSGHNALDDPHRFRFHGNGYHVRSEHEMRTLRNEPWWDEACDTTQTVADMVEDNILPTPGVHLPSFPTPHGYTSSWEYFVQCVKDGAARRYGTHLSNAVKDRINREVNVIRSLGLVDYFLIDKDLLDWARSDYTPTDWITLHDTGIEPENRDHKKPILVGPGRGSASGSAILYCLGITDIDPIRHHLFFERFLDPTRVGMPDVDTDFEIDRRDEGYEYLVARYGAAKIARLGTINAIQTKAAIKDGFRLVGLDDRDANQLTKKVPAIPDVTVRALRDSTYVPGADFRSLAQRLPHPDRVQKALAYAEHFEGLTFTHGIHACGVLISDRVIDSYVPVRAGVTATAPRITTWDGGTIGDLGLLKLDLLGLRTLDIIHTTLDAVEHATGRPCHIPDPDEKTPETDAMWQMLADGETAGVFQLESSGMSDLISAIRPTSWSHLAAAIALYRPGPLGANMHIEYADRVSGRKPIDPTLFSPTGDPEEIRIIDTILGETFGIPIYQEQAMALADKVAGFDTEGVNLVRKAISKKQADKFPLIQQQFLAGAISPQRCDGGPKKVFTLEAATRLWEAIEGSAQYSFNKSHSVAYAQISFTTAFLKSTYPAQFGAAVLAHVNRAEAEKRAHIISFLRRRGVTVHPPAVNKSLTGTIALNDHTVMMGLGEIKKVGKKAHEIIAERDAHGPYRDMHDLATRVSGLSRTHLNSLICAGGLDVFGPRLGLMMIAGTAKATSMEVPPIEFDPIDAWVGQQAVISTAFGPHPLQTGENAIRDYARVRTIDGDPLSDVLAPISDQILTHTHIRAVGAVEAIETKQISTGTAYFVTLSTMDGSWEVVIWPAAIPRTVSENLRVGMIVDMTATVKHQLVSFTSETGDDDSAIVRRTIAVTDLAPIPYQSHVRRTGLLSSENKEQSIARHKTNHNLKENINNKTNNKTQGGEDQNNTTTPPHSAILPWW